jgi:hypothetical protein
MTKRALTLQIVAVTVIAFVVALFFAIYPMLVAIFMMTRPGSTDADLIREIWHFRVVQPEWISGPDQFFRWQQAEIYARLTLVFVGWLASVIALVMRYRRGKRSHLTMRCSERLPAA